ncbi:MAG: hypothetical protein M3178_15330 [Pseudomonadota bacterium]|nr:hypothetical protein [Pseudomonadota bacterium]
MLHIDELFKRRHCEREIIIHCVVWVGIVKLSLRDLVEMMAGRGIYLAPTTVMRGIGRSGCGPLAGSTKQTSRSTAGGPICLV